MLDNDEFDTDLDADNENIEPEAGSQMSDQLRIRRAIEDRLEEKECEKSSASPDTAHIQLIEEPPDFLMGELAPGPN